MGSAAGSRMFNLVTETWNPVTGCTHGCTYCWARRLAETKLRSTEKYRAGFKPALHERELGRRFKPGGLVFVCDMGDLLCSGVPDEWVRLVLDRVARFPRTTFLLLTKNPERYFDFLDLIPPNTVLGATVETDRDDLAAKVSSAPPPSRRLEAMRRLEWPRKLISVEPILDFTDRFAEALASTNPSLVYVGYDNYSCKLPEPPLAKTLLLIDNLSRRARVMVKTLRPAWYEKR